MTHEEMEALWKDPASWRGWVIYHQPADPRVVVPRRIRWGGWTLNFAHPAAWWVLVLTMLAVVLPTVVALLLGSGPRVVLVVMILSALGVISAAHWESTRDRT